MSASTPSDKLKALQASLQSFCKKKDKPDGTALVFRACRFFTYIPRRFFRRFEVLRVCVLRAWVACGRASCFRPVLAVFSVAAVGTRPAVVSRTEHHSNTSPIVYIQDSTAVGPSAHPHSATLVHVQLITRPGEHSFLRSCCTQHYIRSGESREHSVGHIENNVCALFETVDHTPSYCFCFSVSRCLQFLFLFPGCVFHYFSCRCCF